MRDDIDEVHDDPCCVAVGAGAEQWMILLAAEFFEFIGDGAHLPIAGAGGDDDEIADLAEAAHVDNSNIVTMAVSHQLRRFDGEGACVCGLAADLRSRHCGGHNTSIGKVERAGTSTFGRMKKENSLNGIEKPAGAVRTAG